jgi:hypothetical protein
MKALSPRYQTVSTEAILSKLDSFVDIATLKIKKAKSSTTHEAVVELRDQQKFLLGNDYVSPRLHIFNSYRGECPLVLRFGLYRFVCSNGLVIGQSIWQASARHIKGPKIDSVLESLTAPVLSANMEEFVWKVGKLDEHRARWVDVERVLDDLSLAPSIYRECVKAYHNPLRQADAGSSVWLAYNRIQEILARPSRGLAGIHANQRLMDLFIEHCGVAL